LASRLRANEYLWLRRNRRPASIDEKLVGKLLRDTLLRANLRARRLWGFEPREKSVQAGSDSAAKEGGKPGRHVAEGLQDLGL